MNFKKKHILDKGCQGFQEIADFKHEKNCNKLG